MTVMIIIEPTFYIWGMSASPILISLLDAVGDFSEPFTVGITITELVYSAFEWFHQWDQINFRLHLLQEVEIEDGDEDPFDDDID